jgi:hypothetical protein
LTTGFFATLLTVFAALAAFATLRAVAIAAATSAGFFLGAGILVPN